MLSATALQGWKLLPDICFCWLYITSPRWFLLDMNHYQLCSLMTVWPNTLLLFSNPNLLTVSMCYRHSLEDVNTIVLTLDQCPEKLARKHNWLSEHNMCEASYRKKEDGLNKRYVVILPWEEDDDNLCWLQNGESTGTVKLLLALLKQWTILQGGESDKRHLPVIKWKTH